MKAIVIGVDGNIGSALARELAGRGHVVYGTTRRAAHAGENRLFLDLAGNADDCVLPEADIAFFCAAMVGFAACRHDPERARLINVINPARLARRMAAAGTRVVLLSTTAVFDGSMPNVPAARPPCPVSTYGDIAAEAETEFSKLRATSIVRLTKLLTPKLPLFNGWIEQLARGKDIVAFTDIHIAPISIDDALNALLAVAADQASGIYQVSAARDISYYEAACHISDSLHRDRRLVVDQRGVSVGIPPEEAPRYSSLDPARIAKMTGWVAPEPFDVIDRVFSSALARARSRAAVETATSRLSSSG